MTHEASQLAFTFPDSDYRPPSFLHTVELKQFDQSQEHEYDTRIYEAEAAANQFRYDYAVRSGIPSGQQFLEANAHPTLAHHGDHHIRHYEKALKVVMGEALTQSELAPIFEGDFGHKLMQAMMLTVHFHDADQLFGEYRNLSLPKNEHLKVKKGHAIAAAVQIMAMSDLYAESVGISHEEAAEITGMAAVMMMRHDEPGTVSKALSPENRDASEILDSHELVQAFQSDTLNLSTLSPAQMVTILKELKGNAGFIGRDGSEFGLSPAFEKDFMQQLTAMQQDNSAILRLDDEDQQKLKAGTEMAVWADLVDMVAPYWDAIFRTFQGQYSKERPFSWSYSGDSKNRPPEIDDLFSHVLNPKNGNGTENDIARFLWEFYNLDVFTQGTVLEQIPFVREFNKEHAMMGAIALGEVAEAILGSADIDQIIDTVYENRMFHVDERAIHQGKSFHRGRYSDIMCNLRREANEMRQILIAKRDEYQTDIEDYHYFKCVHRIFLRMLSEKYEVSPEECAKLDMLVQSGESALTQLQMFTPDGLPPVDAKLTLLDPGRVRGK